LDQQPLAVYAPAALVDAQLYLLLRHLAGTATFACFRPVMHALPMFSNCLCAPQYLAAVILV
jgi:hypothetical protein